MYIVHSVYLSTEILVLSYTFNITEGKKKIKKKRKKKREKIC